MSDPAASAAEALDRGYTRLDTGSARGRWGGSRLLVRLGVGTTGLIPASEPAVAHGAFEFGGSPVAFSIVIGFPIVVGLGCGVLAAWHWRGERIVSADHVAGDTLGVLLVLLGVVFAVTAVTDRLAIGIAGCVLGGVVSQWAIRSDGPVKAGRHIDLAVGAISIHRLLEGLAVGALYTSGTAIGLVGAAVVAGHTTLETAAVGGLYGRYRLNAVGAVAIVLAGYGIGGLIGFGVADTLPASLQTITVALTAGVLIGIGVDEISSPMGTGRGDWL